MLVLKHINKKYNPGSIREACILTDFALDIPDNQFVSVVGSNGSGKTTLLNIICGSILADSGEIFLDGQDMTHMREHKRSQWIGRVFQNPAMGTCPSMTILENMSIADNKSKTYNLTKGINKKRIDFYKEELSRLNLSLEDKLDTKVGLLSGGQRQAMALLMCTMSEIKFLVLDEHTAALDPKTTETIMELTQNLVNEKKITTIMVTHNLRHAVQYGNRIIMLHEGGIVLDLTDDEKRNTSVDTVLKLFTEISIECGN